MLVKERLNLVPTITATKPGREHGLLSSTNEERIIMSEIVDLLRNAWKSGDAANLENLFPDSLIYLDDLGWSHIGSHAIATDLAQYFSFLREPYKS